MQFHFFTLLVVSIGIYSCSKKSENVATPPPIVHEDTLSAGWVKISVDSSDIFQDIVFQNNATGYVVGVHDTVANTIGRGRMYKTIDGGNTWSKIAAFPGYGAINLAVTDDGKIFVTRGNDVITRSADGGATFTDISAGTGKYSLVDVFFTDNDTGYSVTSAGLITTTNGGMNWTSISPLTGWIGYGLGYNSGWFFTSSSGIVARNNRGIYKSNGSLNSWTWSILRVDLMEK